MAEESSNGASPGEKTEGETPEAPEADKTVNEGSPILKDLVVLPPRQKEKAPDEPCLRLPPLRPEEPVQSIRIALSEVTGYSHITNFRLELEDGYQGAGKEDANPPLVSPYTGPNAVVSVSVNLRSLNQPPSTEPEEPSMVLDDFADLQATVGIQDGSALRMVLEAYDAASVRDHIIRTRQLLAGNPPSIVSLVADRPDPPEIKVTRDPMILPVPANGRLKVDASNLQDFFYLATGEDPDKYFTDRTSAAAPSQTTKSKKKKKKAAAAATDKPDATPVVAPLSEEALTKQQALRMNELEEIMKIPCVVKYSGFHPPPAYRKLVGDIAYLEVTLPSGEGNGAAMDETLFVTATITGFYINKSKFTGPTSSNAPVFDPSPAEKSFFSHALLDCLLQASSYLRTAWEQSLEAIKERTDILAQGNTSNLHSLFRLAIRGDHGGSIDPAPTLDAHLGSPSWLVPTAAARSDEYTPVWKPNDRSYNVIRAEEDLTNHFGVDLRAGAMRDWNDEIQLAREMPTDKLSDRLERARMIHKTMTEFGEAALQGVYAVSQGQIMPMNPNEGTRTQVFLHNNIFISRALDMGPETFRLTKGDAAAKKSVSREIQCIKILQRMEKADLCTLGTVLIDYRGNRFMCQSVLPGILSGEKCHRVLLGSVDTALPLNWDKDVHKTLMEKLGQPLHLRTGSLYRSPLTEARKEECQKMRKAAPTAPNGSGSNHAGDEPELADEDAMISTCVPIESKVIQGSDQRKYVLDFSRMTPRDANWVPENKGGTGRWEAVQNTHGTARFVPTTLDDEEWSTHFLRPELINEWIHSELEKARKVKEQAEKKKADEKKKAEEAESTTPEESGEKNGKGEEKNEKKEAPIVLTEEERKEITGRLHLNVNVFYPDIRIGDEEQNKEDEGRARDAAAFLWDEVLPKLTRTVRARSGVQIPADGRSLTEMLHQNGINCRYLGRLATLALEEEQRDKKIDRDLKVHRMALLERMTMPTGWLELLECEIVARAAKHVLDSYLTEHCAVASWSPAQTVASFLSALVSEREETAAQTENRLEKQDGSYPDDDDILSLKQVDVGGDGDAVPMASRSRTEIWQDVELEVARRFRYSLNLYNRTGAATGRAPYIPLLRRICQRCGIRLKAKSYKVGGVSYTSGNSFGGRLTATFPISPLDVVDVVPLMKHAAAYHEGFTMCSFGPGSTCLPPLQNSLIDATVALERAHVQFSGRALGPALELAQEAANMYQRVTENPSHPGVVSCLDLMANIFLEAGEPALAAENCLKALGLAVQGSGFDNATVLSLHLSLFQMSFGAKDFDKCVKHLRAVIYLLGVMGGSNHYELNNAYLKLFATYKHEDLKGKYDQIALAVYRVLNELDPADRLMDGLGQRRFAQALSDAGEYKEAVEAEKRAYSSLSKLVGPEHELVKSCDASLKEYTKMAVEQSKGMKENEKLKQEAEIADKLAAEIAAAEEDNQKAKKKGNKKKKGKK